MLKLNLSLKLAIGYTLMALLLVICGLVGYQSANKLTSVSEFLVNEARSTVEGSMQLRIGVLQEINLLQDILDGDASPEASEKLENAEKATKQAFQRVSDAGMISAQQLQPLQQSLTQFGDSLDPLMRSNEAYQQTYGQLIANADRFKDLLSEFIELLNRRIVEQETNWDTDEAADSQQSDEWFAATGSTEAKLALFSQLYYFQRFISLKNPDEISQLIINSRNDLEIYIEDLTSMELSDIQEKSGHSSYGEALKHHLSRHKELYQKGQQAHLDVKQKRKHYNQQAQQLLEQSSHIESLSSTLISKQISDIDRITSSALFSILLTVAIGIVIVIVANWLAFKIIIVPIREVADKLKDISQGEGDLTQQLEIRGNDELTELSRGFNQFIQQIRSMVQQLMQMVAQLATTSEQLLSQSSQTERQMLAQQNASEAVGTTMEQLFGRVDSVCDAVATADNSMQQMNRTLSESQTVISSTLHGINDFAGEISTASEVIDKLNRDSQEIGSVLDVIQGIAEQTNLLALNAAIEAARAGEQGRGFAVVADEVRTLASRTQQSTTEIQAIIERLQQGSAKASTVMNKSHNMAEDTVSQTGSASSSLESITSQIAEIGSSIFNITGATSAQNEQAGEIKKHLSHIQQITSETTQSSHQMGEITQHLGDLAQQLETLVGKFKV